MSSSAKYKWLRQTSQRCLHIPRFQVDGQEGLITGGPSGEPQAEKGPHLEDRISFDRNQKPEGICGSQEGGVHQVSTEQSNQVTYSLLRKRPPGPCPGVPLQKAGAWESVLSQGIRRHFTKSRRQKRWMEEVQLKYSQYWLDHQTSDYTFNYTQWAQQQPIYLGPNSSGYWIRIKE